MPIIRVCGDPLLTRAPVLAFGHNARGRTEMTPLEHAAFRAYPAAFAAYHKQCRQQRIIPGTGWLWADSRPRLLFLVVRDSGVGATRLRYVHAALLELARDYARQRIRAVALAPLGSASEWRDIRLLVDQVLGRVRIPIYLYETYVPGVAADEPDPADSAQPIEPQGDAP
jgi:hypothetical protein